MEYHGSKYIVLPKRGFKSPAMRKLNPKARATEPSMFSVSTRSGPLHFNIVDSVSIDGPKIAAMSSFEAAEYRRQQSEFRIVPIVKYNPARRPVPKTSRTALTRHIGNPVQDPS